MALSPPADPTELLHSAHEHLLLHFARNGDLGPEGENLLVLLERRIDNIVYRLGDAECEGLRLFYARAHALSLIERQPELRFHGAK